MVSRQQAIIWTNDSRVVELVHEQHFMVTSGFFLELNLYFLCLCETGPKSLIYPSQDPMETTKSNCRHIERWLVKTIHLTKMFEIVEQQSSISFFWTDVKNYSATRFHFIDNTNNTKPEQVWIMAWAEQAKYINDGVFCWCIHSFPNLNELMHLSKPFIQTKKALPWTQENIFGDEKCWEKLQMVKMKAYFYIYTGTD